MLGVLFAVTARATINAALQMQTGNPTNATATASNHVNYLIQRDQYAMDYNDTTREPNWVAWDLTTGDVGSSGRSSFIVDTGLPAGFYQVLTTDYSGSGYDRGHLCPSADRTVTAADNQVVFTMSNMMPQAPDNNQGVWASFETYSRSLAAAGNEVLLIAGPSLFGGSTIASGVAIPGYTWKIALVVPLGSGSALSRIDANTRIIALKIPNTAGVRSTPWQNFVVSVAQLEADTGYTFLTALPASVRNTLRLVVDGQSAAGAPGIVAQPTSQTTVVGGSATFSVTATGDATLTYQWLHDDLEIAGATAPTLTLNNVQAADVGAYTVTVSNSIGSVTSNDASLVVTGLPPSITASPSSQSVNAGSGVTFSVTATGSPTLTYQWRKGGVAIVGNATATTSALTLNNVQAADTAAYDVVVTNSVNSAASAVATLTVNAAAPTITGQPASATASTGGTAGFTVTATGTAPLTYQWRKAGVPLADGGAVSGVTTASLLLTGLSAVNGGTYDVVVTNALGFATSNAATLTVNPPPPSTVAWTFATAGGTLTPDPTSGLTADITGGTLTQKNNFGTTTLLTTTSASTGTGASGTFNAGAATVNGALNPATSTYFEFTLSPAAGKRLLASGFAFRTRSTGTGPIAYTLYTSVDGYAAPVASGTLSNNSAWSLVTTAFTTVTGATGAPVTFRLYGSGGTGATGSTAVWRVDDLALSVTTVFPPPVPPEVTAYSPANGATIAVTTPITVTFNEAVSFTGSWFSITSAANGPIAASVTGGPTTFTLTPPSFFAYNDTISVSINTAQVVDQSSGTIHGTTTTGFTFATETYVPPTPPVVTTQPASQSVISGNTATFNVAVSGTAPFTYQWRKAGTAITGNASAATPTLTLPAVTTADAGSYDCVVSNVAGSGLSQSAVLTVTLVAPVITTPPVAQAAAVGGSATFTVAATGTAPLSYQWRKAGAPISGATGATLALTGLAYTDSATYDVIVTNAAGFATSNAVALAVTAAAPSAIYWDFATAAPTSGVPAGVTGGTVTQGNNNGTTVLLSTTSASSGYTGASGTNNAGAAARIGALNQAAGGSAYFEFTLTPPAGRQFVATGLSFGARSTGTGPQAYGVYTSVDNYAAPVASGTITVAGTPWILHTPSFAGVTGAPGAAVTFRIYGYNGVGSPAAGTANWRIDDVKLTAGILAVAPVPPSILTAPVAQTVTVGDTVTFTVAATGDAPLAYQWRKAGVALTGNASATTATLTLPAVTTAAAGDYDCVVTNAVGSATSAAATLTVNKAPAAVALGALDFIYDGTPHAATATTTPAGLNVIFTYDGAATAPTNAGTYAVVATIADANYFGGTTGTLTIARAPATIALGDLLQVYTGVGHVASAATAPAGLGVAFTYDGTTAAPVNAGSYAVAATITDANYVGSTTGTLVVAKAPAPVALGSLTATYDGTPKSATATTTPAALAVSFTYDGAATAPANAGSYAVTATVNDANYFGGATGTLTIVKAPALIALGALTATYDGAPKLATATTTPAALAVSFTYDGAATAPTNAGSYAVAATVNDANYVGTATGTLTIAKATATIALGGLSAVYDGSAKSVTATTTPAALAVGLTYAGSATAPTNAGLYPVVATVNDANYAGSATDTLAIAPALATVTLSGLSQTYDGTAKSVTATTAPAGLPVVLTYNGVSTAPTAAGSYAVVALINSPNYVGSAEATLVIAQASATVALGNLSQFYDGTPKSVSVTTTPAGLTVDVTYNGATTAPTLPGTYAVVATITTANYVGTASATLVIDATALLRRAPALNGDIDGSAQVLLPEAVTLNGGAMVSLDLLVPGTPTVRLNGNPTFAGTRDGSGGATPTNYQITLNGGSVLRYLVRRTDAIALPTVSAPAAPTGTRDVSLNSASQSPGSFATLRNLTLNGNVGAVAVPAGTYGNLTANGGSSLVLGVAGATEPAVYNLQNLTINGNAQLTVVGPVILTLANGTSFNGNAGASGHADWLRLLVANGGVTVNGNTTVHARIVAPNGTVTLNGTLVGTVVADRLTINGSGLLKQP
jgi:DNA/RNA endonuclease G (NUC1)